MWSWTEMPTASYRPRSRTVWTPLRTSIEICRLGEGHSLCPWECRLSVGKPFPRRPRKCCQLETRASWPYYTFWCYYFIPRGSIGHLQRVRLANRGRLLLRTPGPVPFGTCICSNIEIFHSCTCHVYRPFEFRTSLGTSILLSVFILSNVISMLQVLFFTHWYSVAAVCRNAVSASCFCWHDKLS